MKCVMDLHTHTIASGHAYSTLQENIAEAQKKGLRILGISDHGPGIPGGPQLMYFQNFKCIPRQYGELTLYCGVEANIMDYDGSLDLDEETLRRIDYVIASMHTLCVKPGSIAENTRASVAVMQNPQVTILGHPDDGRYPLDYEVLVRTAAQERVFLELNNSSLHPLAPRQRARENICQILKYCEKYGAEVILGSDSHISYTIGEFGEVLRLLKETGFPEELIANRDPSNIERILNPLKNK